MTDGYHYTGCGLDYVYLLKGYALHETDHGPGVSIEDARRLHERFGFTQVAHLPEVGWKLGRWVDVGYWALRL